MIPFPASNQEKPLFSIIIPTYNSEKTIVSCLNSVARQTLHDFEVIVQDCLSFDDTISMVSSFKSQNHLLRLRIFEEADLGVYDAMNKALHHARGLWIYFLGSDDQFYEATTLESVSKYINDDVDAIYGDVYSSYFNGRYAGRFSPSKIFHQNICHQSIFLRCSLFDKLGTFTVAFKVAADWEHNLRWFLDHSVNVTYIDQIIAIFAEGGLSSTTPDLYFDSQKPLLYVYYGRKTLPIPTKISLVLNKLFSAFRRRKFSDIFTSLKLFVFLLMPPAKLVR